MSSTTLTPKSFAFLLQKSSAFLRAKARHAWVPLCLAAGCISVSFGQDACWDLQNYHLYNAFALFHPHRHDFNIAQIQSFLNPVLDIPLYLLTVSLPHAPRLIAFCMGLPFGIVAFFTLRIAFGLFGWRRQEAAAALIAALLGLTGTATVAQIGLATNEMQVAALVIAGFHCLLVAIGERGARLKPLLLAGLLTGLAAGAKLTAAPYAIGLAAAALVALPARRLPVALLTIGLAGAIGVAAAGGIWMAHLYAAYGNPIFPYDNQIFNSKWAGPWAYNDTRFFPHSRGQWLLFPLWWVRGNAMVVTEVPFADPRFAAILILAPLALLAAILRRRLGALIPPPPWRAVIIFWLVSYIFWERMFSIYRYAIPLELLGGMIAVGAIRALLPAKPRLTAGAAALFTAAICAATIYPDWGHRPFQGNAIPAALPRIAPRSMVVSTGMRAVSFLALRAPRDTVFVGANSNFAVPDTTITWRRMTSTIEGWRGPIYIIEPAAGDTAGRDIIAAEFNIAATDQCRIIEAAWNDNGLRLCAAHAQASAPDYQPAISFGFTQDDASAQYIRGGWAQPESFGRWSMATDATIVLPVNPANHHPLRLTVLAFSVPSGGSPGRHAQIYANGKLVAQWALNGLAANYQATIPDLQGATELTLRFHIPDATAPFPQQNLGDGRALGIAMMHLDLQEIMAGE
jgi:hypothetical protein